MPKTAPSERDFEARGTLAIGITKSLGARGKRAAPQQPERRGDGSPNCRFQAGRD